MQQASQLAREVFFAICKNVNTPRSLAAWLLLREGEYTQLCQLKCKPSDYSDADSFGQDYMVTSFLKKYKGWRIDGVDTASEALARFAAAEDSCYKTNISLSTDLRGAGRLALNRVLYTAQRKIAAVLGEFSALKCMEHTCWGPGATVDLGRRNATVTNKIGKTPSITTRALPWGKIVLSHDILWFEAFSGHSVGGAFSVLPACFNVVDYDRVITVDKTALTDRTIAASPTLNGFLQQGVGKYIRRRLKKWGVDLDNQEINQEWAREALNLGLCTLDLEAASDTIAWKLVETLLPLDWFLYMDDLRTPFGLMPNGDLVEYEKFSAMGNAYTFELETLIFWALVSSVSDLNKDWFGASVYGDDIICSAAISEQVIWVLEQCGFKLNKEKSYTTGLFYESCGKHYFNGFDVTPMYQKEAIDGNKPLAVLRCGNRVMRYAYRSGQCIVLDHRVHSAWKALRSAAGWTRACTIPFNHRDGDDGWMLPATEFSGSFNPQLGWLCKVVKERTVARRSENPLALYANAVRQNSRRDPESRLLDSGSSLRGDEEIARRVTVKGKRRVVPSKEFWVNW